MLRSWKPRVSSGFVTHEWGYFATRANEHKSFHEEIVHQNAYHMANPKVSMYFILRLNV